MLTCLSCWPLLQCSMMEMQKELLIRQGTNVPFLFFHLFSQLSSLLLPGLAQAKQAKHVPVPHNDWLTTVQVCDK